MIAGACFCCCSCCSRLQLSSLVLAPSFYLFFFIFSLHTSFITSYWFILKRKSVFWHTSSTNWYFLLKKCLKSIQFCEWELLEFWQTNGWNYNFKNGILPPKRCNNKSFYLIVRRFFLLPWQNQLIKPRPLTKSYIKVENSKHLNKSVSKIFKLNKMVAGYKNIKLKLRIFVAVYN